MCWSAVLIAVLIAVLFHLLLPRSTFVLVLHVNRVLRAPVQKYKYWRQQVMWWTHTHCHLPMSSNVSYSIENIRWNLATASALAGATEIRLTAKVNPRTVALVQPCTLRHRGDLIPLPPYITSSLSLSLFLSHLSLLPPSLSLSLSLYAIC